MPNSRLLTTVLTLSVLCAACGSDSASVPKPPPSELKVDGTYSLSTRIDVPPTVLATQAATDFITLLRLLRNDPAAAFFQVLDQAGVPLVADLFAILPSALKNEVSGAINDYWKSHGGASTGDGGAPSDVDQILTFADGTLTRFALGSRLDVPVPPMSVAPVIGHHAVDNIAFDVAGGIPIALPRAVLERLSLAVGPLDADPPLTLTAASGGHGDAMLAIGDHFFGLAYGELIFAALDGGWTGEPLRARLGRSFDCPAMGQAVAKRCLLLACIGHAAEVTQICEAGLDQIVTKVHGSLSSLSFRAVRFQEGAGEMWDAPSVGGALDGTVDRIDKGNFTKASIDVGTGPRMCRASFTGTRSL